MQTFNRLINGDQVVRKQFISSCIFFSFLDCNKKLDKSIHWYVLPSMY